MLLTKKANTKYNDFYIDITKINRGVIFMSATWSPTVFQLETLINSLQNFDAIELYVFDIDSPEFEEFKFRNSLYSDGWGETFWIKAGKVISELKKYTSENIDEALRNNNSIL